MTIHSYIGEKATRTSENLMLQQFLERLEERWAGSGDWIYVIANAMWEGAEIDLVCLLPGMILVADFKHFSGTLTGKENGPWFADGVTVKGGAQNNPLIQLRNNRFSLMRWLEQRADLHGRNLGHISAAPVFSGPVEERLDLPGKVRSWFHVTDLDHCAGLLDALTSPELRLSLSEADAIIRTLGVTEHRWTRSQPDLIPIGGSELKAQPLPLTEHQRDALKSVLQFLQNDAYSSMTITGMTSTGKSRLLVETMKVIVTQGHKPIPLACNGRLARNAEEQLGVETQSIYRHLYLMPADNGNEGESAAKRNQDHAKSIPMQGCTDPDTCVYLIDDAHLLSDSYFQAVDGRVYGSGHLLSDFMTFSGLGKGRRKTIFFGDPYQIQRAGNLSILNGGYQEQQGLANLALELKFLIADAGGNARLRNAHSLVEAIRTGRFGTLRFEVDDDFRIIAPLSAAAELEQHFRNDPFAIRYLAETNTAVADFTRWLRQRIHGRNELAPFEVGDIVELDSVFMSSPMDGNVTSRVQPGTRCRIEELGPVKSVEQSLKGRAQSIAFRLVSWARPACEGPLHFSDASKVANLLEEYIKADKPELSTDLAVALKVWSQPKTSGVPNQPGIPNANSQDEVADDKFNITLARYGYAATVHHAQGLSIPLCYINAKHSAGRHSEGYFRWLYTALTVVGQSLSLVHFKPIDPFSESNWNPSQAIHDLDIPVGGGWHFDPQERLSDADQHRAVPAGITNSKVRNTSVAIYLQLARALAPYGWQVVEINPNPYKESYILNGPTGMAHLSIAYKSSNTVTRLHIHESDRWPLLKELSHACISQCPYSLIVKELLDTLRIRGTGTDWLPVFAVETKYRLSAVLARNANERVELEIDFRDDGRASNIRPKRFTSPEALDAVKGIFE